MRMLRRVMTSKFMIWAGRTPIGNIALCLIVVGFPTFVAFSYVSYLQGILTPGRALLCGLVCGAEGVLAGILLWFLLTRPLLRARQRYGGR
jgi:energy-converting hydrogenase Eha subunit G